MNEHEVYQNLFNKINGPAFSFEKEFRASFAVEHPTLQQAFIRHVVIPALEVLANEIGDRRNHAAIHFAKEALKVAPDYFPII